MCDVLNLSRPNKTTSHRGVLMKSLYGGFENKSVKSSGDFDLFLNKRLIYICKVRKSSVKAAAHAFSSDQVRLLWDRLCVLKFNYCSCFTARAFSSDQVRLL